MSLPASGPRRADVPTPTPRRLYIHDDLSEELRPHGEGAPAWPLWRALCALLVREPERVVVLTPESQIAALIAGREHASFETTVAIGAAGAHVAAQVHERTGWFPSVRRVDVWREESARSEEHTSELQSHVNLVCRLLLEKKKKKRTHALVR